MNRFCFICLLIALIPLPVNAQVLYPTVNFSSEDYNGHSQNWCAVKDSLGFMYFANGGGYGILQYDGYSWRKIHTDKNGSVFSLDVNNSGRIYAGAYGEFGYLECDSTGGLDFTSLSTQLPDSIEEQITNVWQCVCHNGLVIWRSNRFIFIYDEASHHTQVIRSVNNFRRLEHVGDEIWVADRNVAIYTIGKSGLNPIPKADTIAHMAPYCMLRLSDSTILVGTSRNGLFLFNQNKDEGENISKFRTDFDEALKESRIYGACYLSSGDICINTQNNGIFICKRNGKLSHHINRKKGIRDNKVWYVYEDDNGKLWLCLNNGISCVDTRSPLKIAREGDGYEGVIYGICNVGGYYYLGTSTGLYRMNTGNKALTRNESYLPFERLPDFDRVVWAVKRCGDEMLIAASYSGLIAYNPETETFNTIDRAHAYAVTVAFDRDDLAFYGGRNGLTVVEKNKQKWQVINRLNNLEDEVQHIVQQENHENDSLILWVDYVQRGIARIAFAPDLLHYSIKHFASVNSKEGNTHVFNFRNRQVIFEQNKHLYSFDNNCIANKAKRIVNNCFKLENNLGALTSDTSRAVFNITESANGDLWFTMTNHVGVASVVNGQYVMDTIPFSGLDIGEITEIYPDANGLAWICGKNGLARFDKKVDKDYDKRFPVAIRQMRLNDDSVLLNGLYNVGGSAVLYQPEHVVPVLDYKHNSVSFSCAALYYKRQNKLRYSYKLEGYKNEWSSWKADNHITYTNLSGGDYRFYVRAMNVYGKICTSKPLRFHVLPPWYLSWLAYCIYGILFVVILWLLVKLNSRRLERDKIQLEKIIEERTQKITEQKELLEEHNKDITDSIQYAKRIQKAILPKPRELNALIEESFIIYRPKDIVSGDFYWYNMVDKYIVIAVSDCTGHGVPGGFMSMIGANLINQVVKDQKVESPAEALSIIDKMMIERLHQKDEKIMQSHDGMDMSMMAIDTETLKAQISSALRPVIYNHNGEQVTLKATRHSIASRYVDKDFFNNELQLEKGDLIYMFTDGFPDQFGGAKGKKFMNRRFKLLINEIHKLDMPNQKKVLEDTLDEWMDGRDQVDDITVLGIRI